MAHASGIDRLGKRFTKIAAITSSSVESIFALFQCWCLKGVIGGVSRKTLNQREKPLGIVFELLKEFVQLYKLLESADRKADSHDLHVDPVLRKSSTVLVRQQP